MTALYDRHGIQFLYPENWEVSEEQASDWPRSVNVQSPSGAFWSITMYRSHDAPAGLVNEEVLRTMQQEYAELDAEPVTEELAGRETAGYDMNFYCLDLLISAGIRTCVIGAHTYLAMFQAEDREFQDMEEVFRAMTASVLKSIGSANASSEF